jgi:ubiquinone/menaquinone biosynthesis C-methylase UbiE
MPVHKRRSMVLERTENVAVDALIAQPREGLESHLTTAPQYMLGHSPAEIRRLMTQADVLRPTTERLLRAAGVKQGMRVLDLGCGAGDVAILAAELVGPTGSVIGIDRNADVVAVANERVQSAGLRNVDFRNVELNAFTDETPFDCVVSRYVLIHQADPAGFVRASVRFLRPQGIIAFHEPDITRPISSSPIVPRWNALCELLRAAFIEVLPHYDAANRMAEYFSSAGLPTPSILREILVSTGMHSMFCRWAAETLESVQPQLVEMGIFPKQAVAVDTVETKLRDAAVAACGVLEGPTQVGAWARI